MRDLVLKSGKGYAVSLSDPECYPELHRNTKIVCLDCFSDADLRALIVESGHAGVCEFCDGDEERPVTELWVIVERIRDSLGKAYGHAVDQLPYESREGGYQGWNADTYDVLYGEVGLELPNDRGDALYTEIADEIGDHLWCDYDWLSLDLDKSLLSSWDEFCTYVTTERRFFFQRLGGDGTSHPDSRSIGQFLGELQGMIQHLGLVGTVPAGQSLFRAQWRKPGEAWDTAERLGPPPYEYATQSNRMNPPGIPMFYGANTADLAMAEAQAIMASVGEFTPTRDLRVVDLANLPPIPGFFSDDSRHDRLGLVFLHHFARSISRRVARDDRVHINYIPTQIITELLREYGVGDVPIDGIIYPTSLGMDGHNIVLFATQDNLVTTHNSTPSDTRWIKLVGVEHLG